MRQYYVKDVNFAFSGPGQEIVAVESGFIIDHVRLWKDPSVVDIGFDPMPEGWLFDPLDGSWRLAVGAEAREIDNWFYEWIG